MFNVGDKVVVHKPKNGVKNFPDEPVWVSNMDQYDGTEQRISYIYDSGKWIELAGQIWTYGYSWLSLIAEDDEFEAEDMSCLM